MSKVEILVCDICGNEQRQDESIYWALRFGGPVIINFKGIPGCQQERRYETSCVHCARAIFNALDTKLDELKMPKSESGE